MKKLTMAVLLATLNVSSYAADVGVSVTVGDPGFYGHIEIGNAPRPRVIYREPIIIERVAVVQTPVYMRVPPGHQKKWRKHCHKYDACGVPVYFVRNSWYNDVYAPHYRQHREEYERHEWQEDSHDDRGDDHRGKGRKNRGKGRGHD